MGSNTFGPSISFPTFCVEVVEVGDAEREEDDHGDGEGGHQERRRPLHHLLRAPLRAQLGRGRHRLPLLGSRSEQTVVILTLE